jgi:hypothetical protein
MTARYYGKDWTPLDINDKLKKNGGFAGGGNYVWNSLEKIIDIQEVNIPTPFPLSDDNIKQIKDSLDKGYPVMLEIDSNPRTSPTDMHFVLATGYNPNDENDITILDPWDGVEKSLKSYLGWFRPNARTTIERYTIYIGEVQDLDNLKDTEITWDDAEGKRKTVAWYVYEWFIEKKNAIQEKEARISLENNYKDYKKKTNALFEEKENEINSLTKDNEKKDKSIEKLNSTIQKKDDKISSLQDTINKLEQDKELTLKESFDLFSSKLSSYISEVIKKWLKKQKKQ